jgi:hypothetical protein
VSALADDDDTAPPGETDPPSADGPEEPEPRPAEEPPAEEPAREPPPAQPSLDEVVQQIHAIPIGPFLLSTVSTLASIAYGKLEAGQLEPRGQLSPERRGKLGHVVE